MPKQRVNLSIDGEVVKKARELGINISQITEDILRGFSFTPNNIENEAIYEQYQQLFETMQPLLKQYSTSVKVGIEDLKDKDGKIMTYTDIHLLSDGRLYLDEVEYATNNIRDIDVSYFNDPKEILSNFIEALSNGVERRKARITEIEMAKRIIDAITQTTNKSVKSTRRIKNKKK